MINLASCRKGHFHLHPLLNGVHPAFWFPAVPSLLGNHSPWSHVQMHTHSLPVIPSLVCVHVAMTGCTNYISWDLVIVVVKFCVHGLPTCNKNMSNHMLITHPLCFTRCTLYSKQITSLEQQNAPWKSPITCNSTWLFIYKNCFYFRNMSFIEIITSNLSKKNGRFAFL